jgi:G3E family GTPase
LGGVLTSPLPVTLVGGFLGAGKTTLINHLLSEDHGIRMAVVVNDFGEINVDASLIVSVEDDVHTLSNGCICCSMRQGVLDQMFRLAERVDRPEHVVVEASGIADPAGLQDSLLELQRMGVIRFDGWVTVVDAEAFAPGVDEVGRLQARQVRAADLVVVNKSDLASSSNAEARVRTVHPDARLVKTTHARVPLDVLLGASARASRRPPPADEMVPHPGFGSFSWRWTDPLPFRPLFDALKSLPPSVLRAKGWLNLAERPGQRVVTHLVGRRLYAQPEGAWRDEPQSTLVFIGTFGPDDQAAIEARLAEAAGG